MSAKPDGAQLALFDAVAGAASAAAGAPAPAGDLDSRLRGVLSGAIRGASRSREEIAARMSAELGAAVTAAQLNAWTAESKGGTHRFPAAYLPAFCAAVGSLAPLVVLVEAAGGWCATKADRLRAERWGVEESKRELRKRERLLDAAMESLR